MNDHGFVVRERHIFLCAYVQVAAFNRTVSKVDEFLANEASGMCFKKKCTRLGKILCPFFKNS
jgi:hypothetical protein